jgi:hypothetical protein
MKQPKSILTFIRVINSTSFEKITWRKTSNGEKSVVKENVIPTADQMNKLILSLNQELFI